MPEAIITYLRIKRDEKLLIHANTKYKCYFNEQPKLTRKGDRLNSMPNRDQRKSPVTAGIASLLNCSVKY